MNAEELIKEFSGFVSPDDALICYKAMSPKLLQTGKAFYLFMKAAMTPKEQERQTPFLVWIFVYGGEHSYIWKHPEITMGEFAYFCRKAAIYLGGSAFVSISYTSGKKVIRPKWKAFDLMFGRNLKTPLRVHCSKFDERPQTDTDRKAIDDFFTELAQDKSEEKRLITEYVDSYFFEI